MKIRWLRSLLLFWQEMLFILSIGLLLAEISRFYWIGNSIDAWDLVLLSFVLPLLVSLVGQLFWHNKGLAVFLSVVLAVSSFVIILMAIYFVATTSTSLSQAIFMLIFGLILLSAALTMTSKNRHFTVNKR